MLPVAESLAVAGLLAVLLLAHRFLRFEVARGKARPHSAPPDALTLARDLARMGETSTAIAQRARLPHDVITLTVHLAKHSQIGKNRRPTARPAAAWKRMTS